MKNKKIAAKIWKSIFDNLYDREGFDSWWYDIEPDTKSEIAETITKVIRKELGEK